MIQQAILLCAAVLIPALLLALGKTRLLLGWVGFTLSVHVFDTALLTNLPAGRVVGLLYLPLMLLAAPSWLRLPPARAWLINFAYLLVLGVMFGFLWPWPDTTGNRPLMMTAPGRTIIFTIRLISDLSLTVFVARQLRRPGNIRVLGQAIILGAALTALAGIFNFVTKIDPYYLITGLRDLGGNQRARGLSFEPRGLGMACAYGLMVLIVMPGRLSLQRLAVLGVTLLGLLVSYSTSALAIFVAGLAASWLFLSNRVRLSIAAVLLGMAGLIAIAPLVVPQQFAIAVQSVQQRLDPSSRPLSEEPDNLVEAIAFRMDSFDASALLFLWAQPTYALIGTGPGMVLLPASEYVPPGVYRLMYPPERGLDGLPTHGPLFEVANSGILGLGLWLFQVWICYTALRRLARKQTEPAAALHWRFGRNIFLIGTVFYIIQMSMNAPTWSVILGIGWAASAVSAQRRQMAEQPEAQSPGLPPLPA
ncbi:MAG: hypothetical protein JOZ51_25145 [Chloroflexi bacterium]|nr:hypothetical protein [Chloroflexota bacterium]